jgi:dipeptidyl aminopeptidase/acylaminoacyl peptidase
MDLWRVRPDGSDPEPLTDDKLFVAYPTPIDERTVLFAAREADGAGPWLWAVDVQTRESRRVSIGLERYDSIDSATDRRRLVATVVDPQAELWHVPILDRVATEDDAERFDGTRGLRALAPRFRGSSLYFLSSMGSGDGLSRLRDGEVTEIWHGAETALLEPPAISPDGAWIALLLRRSAGWHIHLVSEDGAQRRLLTDRVEVRGACAWSPDGRFLAAGGSVDGVQGLFKIPVDGGEPVRLVDGEALNPQWSPDGDMIVYAGQQVAAIAPLGAVDPDGNPIELPDIATWRGGERYRFMPDGSALIVMTGSQPAQDFERLDLKTMERRPLTRLDPTTAVRLEEKSDIVLIELDPAE